MDISTPQAVEETRQRILTLMGKQLLPVDMAEAAMKILNEAGDRAVMQEISDMMRMAKELRDERKAPGGGPSNALPADQDVLGDDANGVPVPRPTWGRPSLVVTDQHETDKPDAEDDDPRGID